MVLEITKLRDLPRDVSFAGGVDASPVVVMLREPRPLHAEEDLLEEAVLLPICFGLGVSVLCSRQALVREAEAVECFVGQRVFHDPAHVGIVRAQLVRLHVRASSEGRDEVLLLVDPAAFCGADFSLENPECQLPGVPARSLVRSEIGEIAAVRLARVDIHEVWGTACFERMGSGVIIYVVKQVVVKLQELRLEI